MTYGLNLPEYPWRRSPPTAQPQPPTRWSGGPSIGTLVDPTPQTIREALAAASDAPGYPTTHVHPALREAIAEWFARRRGVTGLNRKLLCPRLVRRSSLRGCRSCWVWARAMWLCIPRCVPHLRYGRPFFARAESVPADSLDELDADTRSRVKLIWVNSPANPNGVVRTVEQLREVVAQAREIGAVVASDECYAELGWGAWDEACGGQPVPSILDPRVCDGDFTGLFAVYSLSKQSNLAGYRAAFIAGAPRADAEPD